MCRSQVLPGRSSLWAEVGFSGSVGTCYLGLSKIRPAFSLCPLINGIRRAPAEGAAWTNAAHACLNLCKRPIKRKQHRRSTGLVQEPWSLFKTPRSGPGASGRWSLPSAFRSTKSPLVAAGCRRPPRVNGGRRRRSSRADPASRAGVSGGASARRGLNTGRTGRSLRTRYVVPRCSSAHNPPSRPGSAVSQTACPQLCYAAGLTSF